jgi:hypothetical protein
VYLGKEPKPFDTCSTLFSSINDSYIDEYVEIYAPIDWATPADRKRIVREAEAAIKKAIEDGCVVAPEGEKQ